MAAQTTTANAKKSTAIVALFFSFLSLSALAQETAKVIPKGINRVRGVYVNGASSERWNANGDREVLASPLNRTVSVKEMSKSSQDLNSLYNALNSLEPGLGDSMYQTNLYTSVKMNFQQYTAAWEYGLTKKLTLGVIVPYTRLKAKASFKAESLNSIQAVQARSQGVITNEQWATLQANLPTTATMEDNIFLKRGYKPVKDFEVQGLGDIEVGGKYSFLNLNDKFLMSAKSGFRLPTTSHKPDERNILDQATGDDQLDWALQFVAEYVPVKQFAVEAAVQGTVQFADKQNKALLAKGESGLPDLNNNDNRDRVTRDLGDYIDAEVGTSYGFFNNSVVPGIVYSYYYKQADKYSGGKSYLNYDVLSENTQSYAHRGEVGLKYTTIPLFAAKRFPVPMEVKGAYQTTLAGKNITDRSYYRFDLIVYF